MSGAAVRTPTMDRRRPDSLMHAGRPTLREKCATAQWLDYTGGVRSVLITVEAPRRGRRRHTFLERGARHRRNGVNLLMKILDCYRLPPDRKVMFMGRRKRLLLVISVFLLVTLCILSFASFFARSHWILELTSHFLMQYIIGSVVLAATFLGLRRVRLALLCFFLALFLFSESRMNLENPLRFAGSQSAQARLEGAPITLVLYNHHRGMRDFREVRRWIEAHAAEFDIVVLQEATVGTVEMATSLSDLYPHQLHEPRTSAWGMAILSRHAFLEHEVMPLHGPNFQNMLIRLAVDVPQLDEPLIVYALHAVPPVTNLYAQQRNFELRESARTMAQDAGRHVALIGDLNLTPYSPHFSDLLEVSGLTFQSTGILRNPTWPSFHRFGFLQIPIDHVLHGRSLAVLDKRVVDSFGSDHHALVTTVAQAVAGGS